MNPIKEIPVFTNSELSPARSGVNRGATSVTPPAIIGLTARLLVRRLFGPEVCWVGSSRFSVLSLGMASRHGKPRALPGLSAQITYCQVSLHIALRPLMRFKAKANYLISVVKTGN
jgi:hypothetical protein